MLPNIRIADPSEVGEIARLVGEVMEEVADYDREEYVAKLVQGGLCMVCSLNGELVGAVTGEALVGSGCMIWHLAVKPGHRGMGLGKRLLREYLETLGGRGVEWFCGTCFEKGFWQKMGVTFEKKRLFEFNGSIPCTARIGG